MAEPLVEIWRDRRAISAGTRRLTTAAGDVEEVLTGERYRDRIEGSTRHAASIGVNAVPALVLDRRRRVRGAQPEEVFEQAFAQLEDSA